MKRSQWFGSSNFLVSLAVFFLGAFLCQGAVAQVGDSYFDTPNWIEDDYGWYDQDFDWETTDPWYDSWNDTDLTAWSADPVERAQWGVLGYDDAGEAGAFDW